MKVTEASMTLGKIEESLRLLNFEDLHKAYDLVLRIGEQRFEGRLPETANQFRSLLMHAAERIEDMDQLSEIEKFVYGIAEKRFEEKRRKFHLRSK
jgi:hypothetical protein